jgi:hypothetical protein
MNKTQHTCRIAFVSAILGAAFAVGVASASTSEIVDAEGDATPAHLDIVNGKITEQTGKATLFFLIEVAGAIPDTPSESFLNWNFPLDTNSATAPGGLFAEYVVSVRWLGGQFVGRVNDRTPLLTGGVPIERPIEFSVDGATVKMFVELAALGSPSTLGWRADSRNAPMPAPVVDRADLGGQLATWTR